MEHVINLLNSPVIGKKSSFSFVLLLTGLGISSNKIGNKGAKALADLKKVNVIGIGDSNTNIRYWENKWDAL